MKDVIALLIAVVLLSAVSASASDPALDLGDYLASLQSYDEAITEYKRFLFFHPDDPRASDALHKIGMAYRAEQRWGKAVESMKAAIQRTEKIELKAERRLDLAATLIASGQYNLALLESLKVSAQRPSNRLNQRAHFLEGVTYLYLLNWQNARQALRAYFDTLPESHDKAAAIDALFEEAVHRSRKSATIASILSTVLPGAGQMYVGDWKDGLNALILNGLLGFVTVDAAIDKRYQDAALFAPFLFLRYYMGNRYHAGEAAKQFNDRSDRQHAGHILRALTEQN